MTDTAGSQEPIQVLVVDDDEIDRMAVRRSLERTGIEARVIDCWTADAALDTLSREAIDCVFLDYHLPGTDGLHVLRRVKAEHPHIPVVMLTGQGDEEVAVSLMKGGASDYVPKSAVTPDRLGAALRYALEMARANLHARDLYDELRRTAEAERRARAEAEEANRAKADFLARMSHDLRTPLNAIGGFAQLVLMGVQGDVTDKQRDSLERIQRAQQHLLTLINDILGFARLEAGQVKLSLRPVPVAPVFHEVRMLVEPQAAAKGLELQCTPGPANAEVEADAERLKQVLINLATNAIKFTHTGSITLGWDIAGTTVSMQVRDTGPGIPPEKLTAIFEPFVQGAATHGTHAEGVGLGLAISRELTRLMGGTLSVDSVLGSGATFTLELPATASVPDSTVASQTAPQQP